MKITMYELFGLIKEGKAPEKIKYAGTIYEYHESDNRYHKIISDFPDDDYDLSKRLGYMNFCYLGNEVEIIEEDKKIQPLNISFGNANDDVIYLKFEDKINELIDEINNLKKEK